MASVIEGYNYDIFISYRHKDNKYDGWVTEFVNNLKKELEATFKEEISIYFDNNLHDGLLETHDVDASLKEKLKCLIFMPVISRTYCDPKSFAWEHEFKAFVEYASQANSSMMVKLPDGNVTSRVLPIRIHNLENDDIKLFESVIGGVLRGVEFIYREPGINRSLTPGDDEKTNLNKTKYRNQINKVALVLKEIISGLKGKTIISFSDQNNDLPTASPAKFHEKSIAVLPFLDMSPEKDQDYFCDGITEEIINALAHIEDFKVISRTSAFAFKNKQTDIREIGRILDVKNIVEGSIRKSGDRLRITVQLIKVDDGSHIWSERYDRNMKDVFAIQDEISLAIAENLKIKLLSGTKDKIASRHSDNLEAYYLYLKGSYSYQSLTVDGLMQASRYFEQALQKDPVYALAFIGLGYVNWLSSMWGSIPPDKAYPKAEIFVKKALEIDNTLAEAYSLLATINTFYHWNWKEAELNFNYALQINPNSSMIHTNFSVMLIFAGRFEEAVKEAKIAQELDPLSAYINTRTGMASYFAGNYENAMKEYRMALAINPDYFFTHLNLGTIYLAKKMFSEAGFEYRRAVDLSTGTPFAIACLLVVYYQTGEIEKAEEFFNVLKTRSETEYIPSTIFFMINKLKGKEDIALDWLKSAISGHDTFLLWIKDFPMWFPENSRYLSMLREAGL
jgi:TolB-like protein/Tfp pilus assembly protein PilF